MKKNTKSSKPALSKHAYQIIKASGAAETINGNSLENDNAEEEIMGGNNIGEKSEIMGKNLEQMVKVLHTRLKALEDAATTRLRLCEEDLMPNSKNTSSQAKILINDYDEAIPRSLKDTKLATLVHKDNLVSSDTVYIDPYRLVLRTKGTTETAKKLEATLEETFGNPNIHFRDIKGKKSKGLTEKSKKTEQLKNEAKRINRLKLEKKLQVNMENYVTRSVMEPQLAFSAPDDFDDEKSVRFPISVKWSSRDPLSLIDPDNSEGEFDAELLLLYSLERINLPSGKNMFSWLVKQVIVQHYFVYLFWIIKAKFFDHDSDPRNESFLLKCLSEEFRKIMITLATRAHAEHEKDFVYRFFPFILSCAIYFAFYYVCPGSRHLYSKDFKKTIYMQVIQLMHGIQLCPMTVKVSWAKLFPEDVQDEGGDGNEDETADSFPIQMALVRDDRMKKFTATSKTTIISNSTYDDTGVVLTTKGTDTGLVSKGTKSGLLADDGDDNGVDEHEEGLGETEDVEMVSNDDSSETKVIYVKTNARDFFLLDYLQDKSKSDPLMRTALKVTNERPGPKFMIKRQNNIESINAHLISPQIQVYMGASTNSTSFQPFHRTVPVSWCPTGGSDTHRRRVISTDLHNEFVSKLRKSQSDLKTEGVSFHKQKIQIVKDVNKTLSKLLKSGPNNISRYSLDLMRRQRNIRGGGDGNMNETSLPIDDISMSEIALLAQYDDAELDRFLEDLANK